MHHVRSAIQVLTFCAIGYATAIVSVTAQTADHPAERVSGSITGRITIGQNPAPGIEVQLLKLDANSSRRTPVAKVTTSATGHYEFTGLEAGSYDVLPVSSTMVLPREGRFAQAGKSVTVDKGEVVKGVDFDLVPGGKITGHVTDNEGWPVTKEGISLLLVGEEGRLLPSSPPNSNGFMTNDRGEYSIYGIPPGRYLVSVGVPYTVGLVAADRRSPYEQTFHPAALEAANAVVVEITAGGKAADVDIVVRRRHKTYEMSGRITESATGRPIANVGITVVVEDKDGNTRANISGVGRSNSTGEFKIAGALPGRYRLYPKNDATSNTYGDSVSFEVSDGNVTGLEIKMRRAGSISGLMVMEGADQATTAKSLAQWEIRAFSRSGDRESTGSAGSKVNVDGSFQLRGLSPGKTQIHIGATVPGLPQEFSILRMERNGVELPGELEIGPGEEITGLKVFLGSGRGVIRGQVKVEGGQLDGVRPYLHYRRDSDPPNSYRSAELDTRGRFVIERLIAGEYELMIGPMSVYVTGEAGGKTMSRMPTVKHRLIVTPGVEAEATLVMALAPLR